MSVAGNTRIGKLFGASTFALIQLLDLRTAREWLDRPVSAISKKMKRRPRRRAHEAAAHIGSDDPLEHCATGRYASTASTSRSWWSTRSPMRAALTQDILGALDVCKNDGPRIARGAAPAGLRPGNRKCVAAR